MTFEEARAQFPVLERYAYLNAGTFGPVARATADAVAVEQRRELEHGRAGVPWFERVLGLREELRAEVAELLGVEAAQVALTSSTTDGCNIVVAGLGLTPEDEVVTTDAEHFGLLGPLHASGARVVVVPPEPEAVVAAVTARTRLLALSHVLWTTGRVLPVAELRRDTGVPVLVDGAQGAGAIPTDAREVDFYTVSGQKWLCGTDSTGALAVRDPEALRVARPSYFAQASYEPSGAFEPRPGAARFDANWLAAGSLAGLLAAIRLRPDWAFDRAREATARCRELLEGRFELEPGEATLVSLRVPAEESAALVARLHERGVLVRDLPGRGLVRVSCGWWTSDGDLERLAEAL